MKNSSNISQRTSALIAGISLLLMAVVAGLSYGYLHDNLIVADDAQATFNNLQSSPGLFKVEMFGWSLIFLLDALVAWSLYHFFKKSNQGLAFLSSGLRFVYTAILGIAILNLPQILSVIDGDLTHHGLNKSTGEVMVYLKSFETVWSNGLIVFGLHLLVLGILAYRADIVPKIWGILLIIAGMSYSFLNAAYALAPSMTDSLKIVEMILALPMTLGEVGFAIWLVAKGGKPKVIAKPA